MKTLTIQLIQCSYSHLTLIFRDQYTFIHDFVWLFTLSITETQYRISIVALKYDNTTGVSDTDFPHGVNILST